MILRVTISLLLTISYSCILSIIYISGIHGTNPIILFAFLILIILGSVLNFFVIKSIPFKTYQMVLILILFIGLLLAFMKSYLDYKRLQKVSGEPRRYLNLK